MWTWPFGSPDFRVLAHWVGGMSQRSHRNFLSGSIQQTGPSLSTLPIRFSKVLGTTDGRVGPLGGCLCYGVGTTWFFVSFLLDLTGYGRASECQQRLRLCYATVVHSSPLPNVLTSTFPSPSVFSLEYSLAHVHCSQNFRAGAWSPRRSEPS